jgi:hypothetical protein
MESNVLEHGENTESNTLSTRDGEIKNLEAESTHGTQILVRKHTPFLYSTLLLAITALTLYYLIWLMPV